LSAFLSPLTSNGEAARLGFVELYPRGKSAALIFEALLHLRHSESYVCSAAILSCPSARALKSCNATWARKAGQDHRNESFCLAMTCPAQAVYAQASMCQPPVSRASIGVSACFVQYRSLVLKDQALTIRIGVLVFVAKKVSSSKVRSAGEALCARRAIVCR